MPCALLARKLDRDGAARAVLDGVIHEVHHDLPDLIRIGIDGLCFWSVRNEAEDEAFLLRGGLEFAHHLPNDPVECYGFLVVTQAPRLNTGKVEEITHEPDELLGRDAHLPHGFQGKRGYGPERAFEEHRDV